MKKYIVFIFLLILWKDTPIQGQSVVSRIYIPYYDFIDYQYSKIIIPSNDSTRIKNFYRKVDHLIKKGQGQINILHIGGSHVQADIFSNQVRQNLDAINQTFQSPRGFIFPFSVAKTNNPRNYKVTYTGRWESARNVQSLRTLQVGMAGISVATSDPEATITVELNPNSFPGRWNFDRLRVLAYSLDGSDNVQPVLYKRRETIPAQKDSATNTYFFDFSELTESFTIGFQQNDRTPHTFIVNGFIPEKTVPGIRYHAIGVNGASVSSYLNSELLEAELPLIAPDMVIFGLGINDAVAPNFSAETFINNYNELIAKIKRVNPDCAFIFITNNDSFRKVTKKQYRLNTNGLIARDAFYQIAKNNQGGVWDQFALMGGLRSMQTWQEAGLAQPDKVHFTRQGYELLGDLLYNALIDFYLQNNME
ncbi:MAG: GDSL-type esterase/lipase family protein [Dysgonamonadaceae bacterium]|jgi:lysophospholipase L1-like esterase|nr:GDSL-type esterase/lipase family protein [Dysgonamonadaceae bacterium]